MNPADHTTEAVDWNGTGEHSRTSKQSGQERGMRGGCVLARLIVKRTLAWARETNGGVDAVPFRGPMAINDLRQSSPVYVPRTWRFCEESELTHSVESRYS